MHRMIGLLSIVALAVGCAVPQPQNTPVRQEHEINPATSTGYWLYVPSTYQHDKPAPIIVTCHGTPPFDIAEHHIREWKMLGEQNGCIIIAPELMATDGILGDGPIVGMLENEQRILSIICHLGYRYNLDLANMMITGFSGGGFPTYWVGLRHPEIFSVIAARNCNFSGGNTENWYPKEASQTPVIIYYGSADPVTIQIQSENGIRNLRERGFKVEKQVLSGFGHQRRPDVAMAFFKRNWRRPRASLPRGRYRR